MRNLSVILQAIKATGDTLVVARKAENVHVVSAPPETLIHLEFSDQKRLSNNTAVSNSTILAS